MRNEPEHIKPILERIVKNLLSQYDEPIAEVNVYVAKPKQGGYNKVNIPSVDSNDSLTLLIPN